MAITIEELNALITALDQEVEMAKADVSDRFKAEAAASAGRKRAEMDYAHLHNTRACASRLRGHLSGVRDEGDDAVLAALDAMAGAR